jgi:hypothetical protein
MDPSQMVPCAVSWSNVQSGIHAADQFNNVLRGGQKAMGIAGSVRVEPDDVAPVIDPVEGRRDRVRTVQRGECARLGVVDDAVRDAVRRDRADRR